MKAFFSFAALVLFFTHFLGCDVGAPVDPEIAQLYGTWQWIKTQGGFGGDLQTPQSTGHTASVIFHSAGIAQFFRDDTLVKLVHFTALKGKPYAGAEEMYFIHYIEENYFSPDQIISFQGSDTLRLSDTCMDCFQYTYIRVR